MDQKLDERLAEIEKKLEQNHAILVRIRRVQRNSHIFRLVYWLVIIGLALGAFYYIEPYLRQITQIYTGFQEGQQSLQNAIPDVKHLDQLLDQLKGL
jgi:hypothetical protein